MNRVYNEIRLGRAHRSDVIVGRVCGTLLAVVLAYEAVRLIAERFLG